MRNKIMKYELHTEFYQMGFITITFYSPDIAQAKNKAAGILKLLEANGDNAYRTTVVDTEDNEHEI